mmetsp:Transcript_37984/g.150966  ORF Transcript_37984/g.150966 Transcript_37984/m.150966 type:complete len:96 (-) Transcript_37984:442-729(-)
MGKSFADREEYIQRLRELINRPMLIEMTDGRVIQGLFHCIDHLHNIILSNAEERMMESSNQGVNYPALFFFFRLAIVFVSSSFHWSFCVPRTARR